MKKDIIPNPFSKNSNLAGLAKKTEIIKESLGFIGIIRNLLFLAIVGFIAVSFFKIPINIVLIIIGVEVGVNLIVGYIKIIKMKAIFSVEIKDNANGYREILIKNEYYDLIKSVFGTIVNIISVFFIFSFFQKEIASFGNSSIINLFIFIFVIYRFAELLSRFLKYYLIKNLKQSDNFAEVNQQYLLIEKSLELAKFIPGMIIFFGIFWVFGIPF